MPQLDRLLSAVISNKADALTLDEGDPAKLEVQGAARAVTKSPLTAQQVVGLLKEIAPPDAGRQLDTTKSAAFTYTSSDGAFSVRVADAQQSTAAEQRESRRERIDHLTGCSIEVFPAE